VRRDKEVPPRGTQPLGFYERSRLPKGGQKNPRAPKNQIDILETVGTAECYYFIAGPAGERGVVTTYGGRRREKWGK